MNPNGLFKASIQIQMNSRSKNLDQAMFKQKPMFKQNTLKTPEITNISTSM